MQASAKCINTNEKELNMRKVFWMVAMFLSLFSSPLACAGKAPAPAPVTPPTMETSATTPPTEWERVLQTAKKEKNITIGIGLGAEIQQAVREGFSKRYGITVEVVTARGAEQREKIQAEQRSGAYITDVIYGGSTVVFDIKTWGFTTPLTTALPSLQDKTVFRIDPSSIDPEKHAFVVDRTVSADLMINTRLVKDGEITSWKDLLDPKWKGKIVMSDPRTPGSGGMGMAGAKELGEEYWMQMAAQKPLLERRMEMVITRVATGEMPLAIFPPKTDFFEAFKAGAPLKMVHLKEGSHLSTYSVAIVKNAPHHNVALLLLDWLLSQDGQTTINRAAGTFSLRKDINEDWITIPEFRYGAWQKTFERASITTQDQRDAISFAEKNFGKL